MWNATTRVQIKNIKKRKLNTDFSFSTNSSVSLGTLYVDVSMEQGTNLDLDVVASKNQAFKLTRTSERQEMVILNDRLAVYIEKARTLQTQRVSLKFVLKITWRNVIECVSAFTNSCELGRFYQKCYYHSSYYCFRDIGWNKTFFFSLEFLFLNYIVY